MTITTIRKSFIYSGFIIGFAVILTLITFGIMYLIT